MFPREQPYWLLHIQKSDFLFGWAISRTSDLYFERKCNIQNNQSETKDLIQIYCHCKDYSFNTQHNIPSWYYFHTSCITWHVNRMIKLMRTEYIKIPLNKGNPNKLMRAILWMYKDVFRFSVRVSSWLKNTNGRRFYLCWRL